MPTVVAVPVLVVVGLGFGLFGVFGLGAMLGAACVDNPVRVRLGIVWDGIVSLFFSACCGWMLWVLWGTVR